MRAIDQMSIALTAKRPHAEIRTQFGEYAATGRMSHADERLPLFG